MVIETDLNRREEAERAVQDARRSLARARVLMRRSRQLLANVRASRPEAAPSGD